VLNRKGRYTSETERKVRDAVEELGFAVNRSAQSLKTGTSSTMGILISGWCLLDFPQILSSSLGYLAQSGYSTEVLLDGPLSSGLEGLTVGRYDGLLCIHLSVGNRELAELSRTDRAFVVMGADTEREDFNLVDIDFFQAGYAATKELIRHKHADILFVSGNSSHFPVQEILRGYLFALDENGIRYRDELLALHPDASAVKGADLGRSIMEEKQGAGFSAVLAADDRIALGVLAWARECGVKVPGRLSVMGIGDLPEAACLSPPLSTLHLPAQQMGELGAEMLVNAVSDRGSLVRVKLNPTLVRRSSVTGPAQSR
jgi:DNA-binding LacI/PurR family transcriptional regulator